MPSDRILMGVIGRPHGVRGLVRLVCEAEDPATLEAHVLTDEQGRGWRVTWRGAGIAELIAADGTRIDDRDRAASLARTRLYVERAALPDPDEDEFYHADLIGLSVFEPAGGLLGEVVAVHDYGAGVSLELASDAGAFATLVPFTRHTVPVVNIAAGRIVVRMPDELEWHGNAPQDAASLEAALPT